MDFEILDKLSSSSNRQFLERLRSENLNTNYGLVDKINDNLFEVVNLSNPEKKLMMKLLNMSQASPIMIKLTLNAIESVYNFLGGDCLYQNKFLCYRDFFTTIAENGIYFVSVYEKVDGMSLGDLEEEYINEEQDIPLDILINVGASLLISLFILHSNEIIHRDIKPENIIYNPKEEWWPSRVRIIDFDFSCRAGGFCAGMPGTRVYSAKSLLTRRSLPDNIWARTDVVSLAISLFKLLTLDDIDESYFELDEKIPFDDEEALTEWIESRSLNRVIKGDVLMFAYFLVNLFDFDTNKDKAYISLRDVIGKYFEFFGEYIDSSLVNEFKMFSI